MSLSITWSSGRLSVYQFNMGALGVRNLVLFNNSLLENGCGDMLWKRALWRRRIDAKYGSM